VAGERFCVRNSGAHAVVEGVGDHGCEYMTGGRVVILGKTGRNFAAGMSGGFAYVLDLDGEFSDRVNTERVDLEGLTSGDEKLIQHMVRRHYEYTHSKRADEVLRKWNDYASRFVKVYPRDLKLAIESRLAARTGDG
jgi:glutamate synthase domain-containing protein 3